LRREREGESSIQSVKSKVDLRRRERATYLRRLAVRFCAMRVIEKGKEAREGGGAQFPAYSYDYRTESEGKKGGTLDKGRGAGCRDRL